MGRSRASQARLLLTAAATAAVVTAGVTTAGGSAGAAPKSPNGNLAAGVVTSHHSLAGAAGKQRAMPRALAGVPSHGRYAFLLKLTTRSTHGAFVQARSGGTAAAARSAARAQLSTVTAAQNRVISALPNGSRVLYRMHAVLAGVAVTTDVKNYHALTRLSGVSAVYPIAPKSLSNSYSVPLQRAPEAWQAYGDLGANSTVAIIDTGIDYTHADFGGVGTVEEYQDSKAQLGEPVSAGEFPGTKVVGGYDLVGDDYNADPNDPAFNPVPAPDAWPLDCNSHGTHVAGTVAGYGEDADGNTYTGAYNESTPFDQMRIGPGMAPKAKLYAYRVFGCAGSTNVVADAIDMAADPNGDGDTSDHVDVINMSLGSDYGSPEDGDSIVTNDAAALGINMSVASGNGGDLYDVGGSPGDAERAIAVAASQDAYSQVDALTVGAPESIAGDYAAERSIAYDWVNDPDLTGDVVQLTEPGNLDGCDPITEPFASQIAGHIAFVEWTDNDANRRCGSAARGANLVAAGATGFIYADDEDNFAAGITGRAEIPGVLVAKTGGDAIRTELEAEHTVTISGTTGNGFAQFDTSLNDTMAGFSSRGINDAGNAKPDVTAVGVSVFSAGNGTGNEGLNDSGTSMATPMVAGTAALVHSLHPEWNTEQVKADIMNTADQDLFLGTNHTGAKYGPNRVGTGRIDVKSALDNNVLAYSVDNGPGDTDNGTVSASFGPLAITPSSTPSTFTKTIRLQNTTLSSVTYGVSFENRTTIPGATFSVSPATVTVDPRSNQTVTLTLTIHSNQLTKTIDPTVDRDQAGLPRQYQADASGNVVFSTEGAPTLRVPAYAAPRPASAMTQASSVTLPDGAVQTSQLSLTGTRVNQGSGLTAVQSTVAGFELQATSGMAPNCSDTVTSGCVNFPDERSADLKYVGATSDAPQLKSVGQNPLTDGFAYFSITTQGPWRTAASSQEFDIYIDSNGDGVADAVLFNTRLTDTDVLVTELFDLEAGEVTDVELLNASFGDTDTALFNSNTLVMPAWLGALPGLTADTSRISYSVFSFSPYQGPPVDGVGDVAEDGTLVDPLSMNVLNPGIAVFGSYNGDSSPLLFADSPGSVLQIRRAAKSYATDHGMGALLIHFHNVVGDKAQVVSLNKNTASVSLDLSPNPVVHGRTVTAKVTVSGAAGTPTGTVVLRRTAPTSDTVATGTLSGGKVTFKFSVANAGKRTYRASYQGDANYASGKSPTVTLKVT
jgi:subtilisin family serine protease